MTINNVYFLNFSKQPGKMTFLVVLRDGLYRLPTKSDLRAIGKCFGERVEFVGSIKEQLCQVNHNAYRIIHTAIPAFFEALIRTEVFIETPEGINRFDIKTLSTLQKVRPEKVVESVQLGEELKAYLRCVTV